MVVAVVGSLGGCGAPSPQLLCEGCDAHLAERYGEPCDYWRVDVVRIGPSYDMGDESMAALRHGAIRAKGCLLP